jgi:uncharacterized membrane protein YfcA
MHNPRQSRGLTAVAIPGINALNYNVTQLLTIAVIMGLGSVIQAAVGFASGLLGIPLLVLSGFSLPEATTINIVSTSVQNLTGAIHLRQELAWRDLLMPMLVRWSAIPLGVFALGYVDGYDQTLVKQIIGGLLLAVVLILWISRTEPRERLALPWQLLAFSTSGFLMGLAAMGGGPIVLYVNSVHWSAAKSRAFLFFMSVSGVPIAVAMLAARFGTALASPTLAALLILPVVMIGMNLGFRLGARIDKPLFRQVTFVLLVLIGVGAVLSPYVARLSES